MGGIILNPEPFLDHSSLQTEKKPSHLYFPTDNPHTISYSYWKLFGIKAHYVMRLIEIRIGQELLLKVRCEFICYLEMKLYETEKCWRGLII